MHFFWLTGFRADRVPSALDAVVIGSGIGGLTAAALLAKAGKKVLVLEQHDQAGGCTHTFQNKGFEFDVGKKTKIFPHQRIPRPPVDVFGLVLCVDNSVCLHQASITWASFMRTACCGSPWIRSQTDSYSSLVWDNTLTRWSWVSRSSAGPTLDSLSVCLFVFSINNVCFSTNKILARCFQGILHPRREN